MVYADNYKTVLLNFFESHGLNLKDEELEQIIVEINQKYSVTVDKEKLHPLTRAFLNLQENKKQQLVESK